MARMAKTLKKKTPNQKKVLAGLLVFSKLDETIGLRFPLIISCGFCLILRKKARA
jgi:hypothetical protein